MLEGVCDVFGGESSHDQRLLAVLSRLYWSPINPLHAFRARVRPRFTFTTNLVIVMGFTAVILRRTDYVQDHFIYVFVHLAAIRALIDSVSCKCSTRGFPVFN